MLSSQNFIHEAIVECGCHCSQSHHNVPLTRVFSTTGAVGVVGLHPPQPSASHQLYLYPNSPYPKLQAANGSTVTIRHGTPEGFLRAIDEVREGRMGFCKAGRLYGVSHATLQKYYKAMGYTLRNRTNNPNFRKRPDGTPLEPRRRYYSVPASSHEDSYLSNTQNLFPHIMLNPRQGSHFLVQNDDKTETSSMNPEEDQELPSPEVEIKTETNLTCLAGEQVLQSEEVVRGPLCQSEKSVSPYMRVNSGEDKEGDTAHSQSLQSPCSGLHFSPSYEFK